MGKKKQKKINLDINKSKVAEEDENVYEAAIKELSLINKSNGLVVGTNETLRRLERDELDGVFLFSQKASSPIYHSLSLLCRKTGVPFILLKDNHKSLLGQKFPTSITYGVKKECVKDLEALAHLLNKIKSTMKIKKTPPVVHETIFQTPEVPEKEMKLQNESDSKTFYHKKHAEKKSGLIDWTHKNFLSFSESTISFPDYDSVFKSCEFSWSAK
ncbi:hypothetical protein JTE90_006376 [Oedothorax gibbosus]|uniref:Ribosomal protein eL8/eL30/eS12/Gadd45 domain-containing protein n=1 Tax=Oedothorax gibbosus TaxID=931172 RepID=A0AAV6VW63_9ARAC|nr:hypothetical protein JTE90_006376 [Oedothorax gibbosus]